MHRALDLRIAAVMPVLQGYISFEDEETKGLRQKSVEPVLRLINAAQADGSLRPDVAYGDIGLMLSRLRSPASWRLRSGP